MQNDRRNLSCLALSFMVTYLKQGAVKQKMKEMNDMEKYEKPVMEVIELEEDDVILTSCIDDSICSAYSLSDPQT